MSRFLCIADLHLGKGAALGREPGERLAEQEAVWRRALEIGAERDVDAVLFAGDVFEGPIPTPEHYAAFARPLRDSSLPVLAISGNGRHDAAMRDTNAVELLRLLGDSQRLRVYTRPKLTAVGDVSIACLPWTPVSRIVAAQDGGDRDEIHQVAAQLLVDVARELREKALPRAILLTHFSISGASLPGGMTSDQLREPVLALEALEALGFGAVVAGHLHPPQHLTAGALPHDPVVFYCGSPLPLDFGEGGTEHGVWILDIDHAGESAEFVPIESRRFVTLDWDHDEDPDVVAEISRDGDHSQRHRTVGSYVKARITATEESARSIDAGAVRDGLLATGAHRVWVELNVQRAARARVEGLDESVSEVDAFDAWLDSQGVNGDQAPALRSLHQDYLEEVAR